jgi:pimeloyl-ACP methyl ester carboxylesterase
MIVRNIDISAAAGMPAALAGDEAYRRFCQPSLSHHRNPLHDQLVSRARVHLAKSTRQDIETPVGRVPVYQFHPASDGEPSAAPPPTVLLVHGWTSEASFMAAFIEPLRQKGWRVVSFDMPGHGFAEARRASMIDCARAMSAVVSSVGPVQAVIAHSIGAMVAALVSEGGRPLPSRHQLGRLALIAAPNALDFITADHASALGLSSDARRWFERHVQRVGHRPIATFSTAGLLQSTPGPVLVVHSRDDAEVPFSDAEAIAGSRADCILHAVDDLGHARVLYAPPVVRKVRDFVLAA